MSDFFTLSCPTCGGKLQITSDIDRFACGHCGNEHVVSRVGGTVSVTLVVEGLKKVQAGTDKTASELAIQRFKQEIAQLQLARDSTKTSDDIGRLAMTGIGLGVLGILGACVVNANRQLARFDFTFVCIVGIIILLIRIGFLGVFSLVPIGEAG